jgi:hypothetical protein
MACIIRALGKLFEPVTTIWANCCDPFGGDNCGCSVRVAEPRKEIALKLNNPF